MHPLGDTALDADHDGIITQFEALRRATVGGDRDAHQGRQLAQTLLHYVTDHCDREERLMAMEGYGELEAHAAAHRRLQTQVRALMTPLLEGSLTAEEDLHLVRDTFLQHILTWDEVFGAWRSNRCKPAAR